MGWAQAEREGVGVENPSARCVLSGLFLGLVVFQWRPTGVHHDGVELE
jgi:hypothetical protein